MFSLINWPHSWNFLPSAGDKPYGMNDSGWDTFAGTPFKSLAREICQNSLDAKQENDAPAYIEFQSFDIDQFKIPQIGQIQNVLQKAMDFWKIQQNDPATEQFLSYAYAATTSEKIRCLRISDHNTTGLRGSDKRFGSAWCNLLKAQGVSDKSGTSGGSKGIGKFAPFACSSLRTVFYSTVADDNLQASQGVSRLISFLDNDILSMGLGYYGEDDERCSPIKEQLSLDPNYIRDPSDFGTDIFIIGFTDDPEWKDLMIGSVLDGFLYAINDNRLIVKIDDVEISRKSLPEIMESLSKEYLPEHADEYYQVLTSEKAVLINPPYEVKNNSGHVLGTVTLRVMLNADFHRRCAMVRQTGMKIMDNGGVSSYIVFAGVLYIEGDELNTYLRKLENAQHTEWQIERLNTAAEKKEARELLRRLRKYIKDSVSSLRAADQGKPINLSIGEYLSADVPDKGEEKQKGEGVNDDISTISVTTITKVPKVEENQENGERMSVVDDPNGDVTPAEGDNGRDHHGHHHHEEGENQGDGGVEGISDDTPDEKRQKLVPIPSSRTRLLCTNKTTGEYVITYRPRATASNAVIDIALAAESQNYSAELISAHLSDGTELPVKSGQIHGLTFTKDTDIRVSIRLNYKDLCALEVKGYGNQS